jgi:hypothetical protein
VLPTFTTGSVGEGFRSDGNVVVGGLLNGEELVEGIAAALRDGSTVATGTCALVGTVIVRTGNTPKGGGGGRKGGEFI